MSGTFRTREPGNDKTAFGELLTAELTPILQSEFSYHVNEKIWKTFDNNGTITTENNMAKVSTGAAANQSAALISRTPIKYHPGQGSVVEFTTIYTTGVANSKQIHGVIDSSDGLAFGYNGAAFGVLRRVGGVTEIRTLTVTTKSTTAENITITLDGDADTGVTVTDATSGDVTTTANDIASHDFSNLGTGWQAVAIGDTVLFTSYTAKVQTGTYTLSGATTAIGTFAQTIAGVAATDTWVAQADWNIDGMGDVGNTKNPSGMTLDHMKGNIYKIQYQWLGFGPIYFYVEKDGAKDLQGKSVFQLVHVIEYNNANTTPSIFNPTLPLCMMAGNTSNTSDIVMYSGSMAGFVEGKTNGADIHHGVEATKTNAGTAEIPILTVRNKLIYQGKVNRNRVKLIYTSVGVDHGKNSITRFKFNATLTGASFSDVDTNDSMMSFDSTATGVSSGDTQLTVGVAKDSGYNLPLSDSSFYLNPGDSLTITQESTAIAGATTTASFNLEEHF